MTEKKGFRPYFDALREAVDTVDGERALESVLAEPSQVTFLDVRQTEEYSQGAIKGAIHIPRGVLELAVEGIIPDKQAPIVVYCQSGVRSVMAAKTLAELDYTGVVSLDGGFGQWKDAGRPWETPAMQELAQGEIYTDRFLAVEDDND